MHWCAHLKMQPGRVPAILCSLTLFTLLSTSHSLLSPDFYSAQRCTLSSHLLRSEERFHFRRVVRLGAFYNCLRGSLDLFDRLVEP